MIFTALALLLGAVTLSQPISAGPAEDLGRGIGLYNAKKYAEAQKTFEVLAKGQSNQARSAYYYLACCYYQLGQLAPAKTLLKNLSQSAPQTQEGKMAQSFLAGLEKSTGATRPAATTNNPTPATTNNTTPAAASAGTTPSAGAADPEFASLPAEVKIPYTPAESGHFIFEIWYDGARMNVALDTGVYANLSLAKLRRLGLPDPGPIPDGKTYGWNGVPLRVWHVKAKVKAGNLTRTIPIELEDNPSEGLAFMGMALLKGYSYEIDPSRKLIVLHKSLPKDLLSAVGKEVPLLDEYGIDNVMVNMNGKEVRCRISTALPVTTINDETATKIGAKAIREKTEIHGIGGPAALNMASTDISLGPVKLDDVVVNVAESGPCSIGIDVIRNRHYVVDHQKNVLRFLK